VRLEAENTVEARDRLANLSELVSMASSFDDETEGRGTLAEFEERISLASANDDADGRGTSMVTMTTVHAAKGLEFPVVFVCGLEEGLFPSLRDEDQRELEEERRLAYVAFTRAMDRLVLSAARMRRHWGEVRSNRPSRFVDAIPAAYLAVRARPAPRPRPTREALASPRRRHRDELDQRTHEDDLPSFDVDAEMIDVADELGAGATVAHETFGFGRVVESRGAGKDRKLVVDFGARIGVKTILARWVVVASEDARHN
jgi:DNA helicase-2/ATP-dependent DNA helicase PcrA